MAELAASGEVGENEIYETGYRWDPALECWRVFPECRNQPFAPNGPYMGLDGTWKKEKPRSAITGRLVPGADLSDVETARELVNYFKTYEGEEPPKRLLDASPEATYAWFKENLVGKTFQIGDRTFTVKEGHYFRFVCETPKTGKVRKGWIGRANSAEEARRMVEAGELAPEEISGYVPSRAASLPFASSIFTRPDAILTKGHQEILLKKFKTGNAKTDVAVFLLNRDGETLGLETVHMREIGMAFLNGSTLAAFHDEGAGSPPGSLARDVLSPTDDARDTSAGTPPSQTPNTPDVNSENQARAAVAPSRPPSPEFAMDGTVVDALPAHLRADARAIVAERANTPRWMTDPDGTPTELNERDWLRREAEARHNAPRFAISGLYTGSAADYDKPSLHFVGTGEGNQVYGWGLYASDVRGVAERYALRYNQKTDKLTPAHLYEQTFFTNRATPEETERHLLKWYDPVSEEQKTWITKGLTDGKTYKPVPYVERRMSDVRKAKNGGEVYQILAKALGSPQSASEFLARAGIDGIKYPVDSYGKPIKDGDKAGWNYVSFRDDNIRVDHKWVDGEKRYAIAGTAGAARMGIRTNADAEAMERSGATREEIWRETGWWKWNDGEWRRQRQTADGVRPPSGAQKQAGTEYPDAGAEIGDKRFAIGAGRRAEYERLLAKHRPDLDAGKVLAELDKYGNPRKEKAALHWVIRGTVILPEDEYKVDEALSVAEKAKADPLKYRSPLELLEAHKEFKPTAKAIDPDTVPELNDKRDEGGGIVSYEVEDTREGQASMRRIIDTHWGADANPWCLLARVKGRENDHGLFTQDFLRWQRRQMETAGFAENAEYTRQTGKSPYEPYDEMANAWSFWNTYNALPKRVAFKDGKLLAFMATEALDEDRAFDDAAYGSASRLAELYPEEFREYEEALETDEETRENQPNFYEWLQHHEDYYELASDEGLREHAREEWWDRQDESHPDLEWAKGGGKRYSIQSFADGTRYVHVDVEQEAFEKAKEKDYPKVARRIILKRFRGKVIGGEAPKNAYVKTSTAGEFAYPSKPLPRDENTAKMRSAGELDNLLAIGEFAGHEPDDGHHPEASGGWDYYNTIFEVGGRFFTGKVNLLINNRGRVFHDVTGIKENTQGLMSQHGEPRAQFPAYSDASQAHPGAEVKSEEDRAAVTGRVVAFDDEPRYSPRGTVAALATLSYIAGVEPNREGLAQVGERLGQDVNVDEAIAEAKTIHDAILGKLEKKGNRIIENVAKRVGKAGKMNPGEVAQIVAEAVQAMHPEDLLQEAYMRGAGAQEWARGTRGAALNALVRQARGDNYADLVTETGLDATGVLQAMVHEKAKQTGEGLENGQDTAQPAQEGQEAPAGDVGPIDRATWEKAEAMSAEQEANLEKAVREMTEEMAERRAEAEEERQRAESQAEDPIDEDDPEDGGDVDENDREGEADEVKIPLEILQRNLVDAKDPASFALLLRKIVRNRILKANGMGTDFGSLEEAQRAERKLWENPTNVAMFAKSMSAILRDMANRMLDHRSGAYTGIIRKAAVLPHYDSVDAIEKEVEFEVRVLSSASERQTSAALVNNTRKYLKRFIGPVKFGEHPELEEDLTRRITGRVREMARWYRRVLSMSENQINRIRDGWTDKDGKHHDGLRDILDQRGRALEEAGMGGENERENDAVFSKASWRLAVLNLYGGTRYLLPAEARARCAEIETWMAKEALAWAQKIESIQAKYEADRKTILDGCAVVDPKTGEKRVHEEETKAERFWRFTVNTINQRLRFLFARATGDARKAADELIRRYSLELTRGTTRYIREKQNMRRDLALAVRSVVGPRGVRKWLKRMMEEIPEEHAVALSKQGNRHLTYGQVMHLYGYLRQTATYGDNIAKHGREAQREYIERNVLTPEDLKILNLMMKIYADRRQALDEASRDLTGFPMKNPDPFYLPVKIKTPAQSGLETVVSTVQAMPDVFSERRKHGLDVDEKADIMVIFHDRMEKTARVLGFGRTGLDIIHTSEVR